jgi:hypothetical protein
LKKIEKKMEKAKKSKLSNAKAIIYNWAENTTAHGVSHVFKKNSHPLIRLIWLIFILGLFGYMCSTIIKQVISYFDYGVTTSTKYIIETPTNFPAVDICNLNAFDGKDAAVALHAAGSNNLSIYVDGLLTPTQAELNALSNLANDSSSNEEEYYHVLHQKEFNYYHSKLEFHFPDYLYHFGFKLDEIVISCLYQNKPCNMTSDWRWFHSYHYGNCFRFNGGWSQATINDTLKEEVIKTTKKPGAEFGLILELFVGDPANKLLDSRTGFKIIINNQSVESLPSEEGITVGPGLWNEIAIERTFINTLPSPFSNCITTIDAKNSANNNVLDIMLNRFNKTDYHHKFCLKLCLQLYLIKKCGCGSFKDPIDSTSMVGCHDLNDLTCIEKADDEFWTSSEVTSCYKLCPEDCRTEIYTTQISSSKYPTNGYAVRINASDSFSDIIYHNGIDSLF